MGETTPGSLNLLRGLKVRLAALTHADLPTLAVWHHDVAFLRCYDSRPAKPKTEAEVAQSLAELQKDRDTFAFAVRPLHSETLIGYIELDNVNWQHGVCGMALGIGDSANWGKGYGLEATQLALEFAFQELNLHRVQATVFAYNNRSLSLLEKLGFQREGVFREFLHRDGRRHDMILYGLLCHECEAQQASHRC